MPLPFQHPILAALLFGVACFGPLIYADECPDPPLGESCVSVADYNDFRTEVQAASSGERVVFCPFQVEKGPVDKPTFILNKTDVEIICKATANMGCTIDGEGSHIKFYGSHVKATIQGFTFKGATKSAVSIEKSSLIHEQTICDSNFVENVSSQGGAALKINKGTSVSVRNCRFMSNQSSKNGGAISNRGNAEVYSSTFEANQAESGSAIMNHFIGYLELINNEFNANIARDSGPAVYMAAVSSADLVGDSFKGNTFTENYATTVGPGDCNGIFTDGDRYCVEIESLESLSKSPPTGTPTSIPTVSPTNLPSDNPTKSSNSLLTHTEEKGIYGLCEGDCDSDSDCEGDLICFKRTSTETVPGCHGVGEFGKDYCTNDLSLNSTPNTSPTNSPTLPPSSGPTHLPTSSRPTTSPSSYPTHSPTSRPSVQLTFTPSRLPTRSPTILPTFSPTVSPINDHAASKSPYWSTLLNYVGEDSVLGLCQGDCDNDSDCDEGLICFKRRRNEPVPGCTGVANYGKDYCIYENATLIIPAQAPMEDQPMPTVTPTEKPVEAVNEDSVQANQPSSFSTLKYIGEDNNIYGLCEGDCDKDSQCGEGLICFKRKSNEPVPGCVGDAYYGKDYCVYENPPLIASKQVPVEDEPVKVPTPTEEAVKEYGAQSNQPTSSSTLKYIGEDKKLYGLCEGDCDSDSQCGNGLVCFKRRSNEAVPGCVGEANYGKDYCVHENTPLVTPTHPPTNAPVTVPTNTPITTEQTVAEDSISGNQPATSTEHNHLCPPPPPPGTSCVQITTYDEFRKRVVAASSGERIVFCEFTVEKKEEEKPTWMQTDVHIVCKSFKQCTIVGEGMHVGIVGSTAKALVQGFTFMYATESAVRILKTANIHEQRICHNDFLLNESLRRGAALKIEEGTKVSVGYSSFTDNYSDQQGGGTYNEGDTNVFRSRFRGNHAHLGGGIFSGKESSLTLVDNEFTDNIADGRGPAVYIDEDVTEGQIGHNKGCCNDATGSDTWSCNGVYHEATAKCSEFEDI